MKLQDTKQVISILHNELNNIREHKQYIDINNEPQDYGTEADYKEVSRLLSIGLREAQDLQEVLLKQKQHINRKGKQAKWEN